MSLRSQLLTLTFFLSVSTLAMATDEPDLPAIQVMPQSPKSSSPLKLAAKAGAGKQAAALLPFSFESAEITKIISIYAKASGKTFVVDPTVRGKISIYSPKPVSLEDAFALLSTSLAVNQFAIIQEGDTCVVMSSRNAQRSMIPVVSELPPIKPERMVSMIFRLKYLSAEEVNKRLRFLPSKDGELTPFGTDRLFVTDWATNINRIALFLAELDQPGAEKLKSKSTTPSEP
jgi:general secretion pathway protein D